MAKVLFACLYSKSSLFSPTIRAEVMLVDQSIHEEALKKMNTDWFELYRPPITGESIELIKGDTSLMDLEGVVIRYIKKDPTLADMIGETTLMGLLQVMGIHTADPFREFVVDLSKLMSFEKLAKTGQTLPRFNLGEINDYITRERNASPRAANRKRQLERISASYQKQPRLDDLTDEVKNQDQLYYYENWTLERQYPTIREFRSLEELRLQDNAIFRGQVTNVIDLSED